MDLYSDYDGVLVNFDKGTEEYLGNNLDHASWKLMAKSHINKILAEKLDNVKFWAELQPMPDFQALWGYIKYWSPHILTAYPSWGPHAERMAKQGKMDWNRKWTKVPPNKFHCVAREEKQKYAMTKGVANVLIDDHPKNCQEWTAKGGHAILHKNATSTIAELKKLGFKK